MSNKTNHAEYTISNNKVQKDGQPMFMADVAQDLKRKSYLEEERKAQAEKINELMAHVERIENLEVWGVISRMEDAILYGEYKDSCTHAIKIIAQTPAQSLSAVRNECYEKAAVISENIEHWQDSATEIRNLKDE